MDQVMNYISKELRAEHEAPGVILKEAPIENPGTVGTVERSQAPLRSTNTKIRAEAERKRTDMECLKMAVFTVNQTVGRPEGLFLTLRVFRTICRPAHTTSSVSELESTRMIDEKMVLVEGEQAKRKIAFRLKHGGGPVGGETARSLQNYPQNRSYLCV